MRHWRPAVAQSATVAAFNGAKVRNVLVTVIDNDTAGILLTEVRKDAYDNGTTVLEGAVHGFTDTYKVELTKAPTADVTVTLSFDNKQLSLSSSTLTFTSANWNVAQTVTVTAVDDTLREDPKLSLITHSVSSSTDTAYFAAGKSTVSETLGVAVNDDDVPGVLVQQSLGNTLVGAGAGSVSDSYTVRLTKAPTGTGDDHAAQRRADHGVADAADLRCEQLVDSAGGHRHRRGQSGVVAPASGLQAVRNPAAPAVGAERSAGNRRRRRRRRSIR
jgi:hypothetical protein